MDDVARYYMTNGRNPDTCHPTATAIKNIGNAQTDQMSTHVIDKSGSEQLPCASHIVVI